MASPTRAQPVPDAWLPSVALPGAGEHVFGGGKRAAGARVGASRLPLPLEKEDTGSYPHTDSTYGYNTEFDLTNSVGGATGTYDDTTNLTLTRDVAGRVTSALTQQYNAEGGGELQYTQSYSYYPTGQLATSPQGSFTYDARGLVATRTVPSGEYQYGYDSLGRNTQLTYPDGHVRTQRYDTKGRIESRCYTYGADDAGPSRCYGATYDPVGNPLTLTDPEGTDGISYDALDRVTSVVRSVSGTAVSTETYTYNALGALKTNVNVTMDDQRPVLAPGTGTAPAAIPNTYNGAAVTVNNAGQITSLAGTSVGYDLLGRVTNVAGSAIARDMFGRVSDDTLAQEVYTYDGANRSIAWQWKGGTQGWVRHGVWIYDGVDHPLEHVDENGVRQYYELDLAGNVRRLMGPGGVDLGGYRYTAFGQSVMDTTAPQAPTGAASLPVRWKGRWLEYSTGSGAGLVELYDMRARWWWPQGAVFIAVDDFAFHDAGSTVWGWGSQNPLRWSDPSGNCPACLAAEVGAFAGAISYVATANLSTMSFQGLAGAFADGAIAGASTATGSLAWSAVGGALGNAADTAITGSPPTLAGLVLSAGANTLPGALGPAEKAYFAAEGLLASQAVKDIGQDAMAQGALRDLFSSAAAGSIANFVSQETSEPNSCPAPSP